LAVLSGLAFLAQPFLAVLLGFPIFVLCRGAALPHPTPAAGRSARSQYLWDRFILGL